MRKPCLFPLPSETGIVWSEVELDLLPEPDLNELILGGRLTLFWEVCEPLLTTEARDPAGCPIMESIESAVANPLREDEEDIELLFRECRPQGVGLAAKLRIPPSFGILG